MINAIMFVLMVSIVFILVLIPLEFIWTKLINNPHKVDILSKNIVEVKLLDKKIEIDDSFANPMIMTINPGFWVLANSMKDKKTSYYLFFKIKDHVKKIKVSQSVFENINKGDTVKLIEENKRTEMKVSLFEMLALGSCKRTEVFNDSDYSLI